MELISELSRKYATISDPEKRNKVQAKSFSELYQTFIERERSQIEELGGGESEKKTDVQDESILELKSKLHTTMERKLSQIQELYQLRLWIKVRGAERHMSLIKEVENL